MTSPMLSAADFDEFCGFVRTYVGVGHQNQSTRRFESLNERLAADRECGLSEDEFDEYASFADSLGMSLQDVAVDRAERFFSLLVLLQAEHPNRKYDDTPNG